MRVFGISALLALVWAQEASGHAMFMTEKGTSCLKKLAPGIEIMGVNAVLDDKTSVIVTRGDLVLENGASYVPGEALSISLNHPGEVLFEVLGGGFRDGYCDTANRMVPNASGIAVFEAPMDGMDVKIWAGYASSHTTVKISKDFVLKGAKGARTGAPAAVAANTTMPVTAANGTMATPRAATTGGPKARRLLRYI